MHQFRAYASIALAALLTIVLTMIAPLPVSAGPVEQAEAVPPQLEVPPGYELLFRMHARGVQIYECRQGQWAFRAPRAALFDPEAHRRVGDHYGGIDRELTPGPWWESREDGSRIRAGNALSAPSPNEGSIPLLRLEVLERQGAGMFTQVSYIQRLNTVGGVGPTGACNGDAKRQVVYTADYYFFGAP